jgi:hypothetical protein
MSAFGHPERKWSCAAAHFIHSSQAGRQAAPTSPNQFDTKFIGGSMVGLLRLRGRQVDAGRDKILA